MRKADSDRRIWIDAICIDQDDEREKSSQVRHMHAVYSRAEEVCIYWGECAEQAPQKKESYPFFKCSLCRRLKNPKELSLELSGFTLPQWVSLWDSGHPETPLLSASKRPASNERIPNHKSPEHIPCRLLGGCAPAVCWCFAVEFAVALEEELLRDVKCDASSLQLWWKRLWTVQELLLAKHPVIYCGPCVMLWETILRIWIELDNRKERAHLGKGWKQVSSRMRMGIIHLHALRGQSERNLHVLLLATIDKGFTEPKDRILALLGALPKGALSLDYGLDLRVIYTSAAMHCIATQHTFDILFSQWKRRYQIYSEPRRLYSCVPDLGQSRGTLSHTRKTPCLMRLEQGRWESSRVNTLPKIFSSEYECQRREEGVSVLRSREIGMEVIENSASQCRIAFNGASVTAVRQIYRLGQHELDCILTDLSTSPSRYFAESLCEGNRHWGVSATDRLG